MKGIKEKIRRKRHLRWILIFTNWLSQGILHLDITEKSYRIIFTIVFSFVIWYFLELNIFLSFIIGHTINWLTNECIYSMFVHQLLTSKVRKQDLFDYLENFSKMLENKEWVLYAASFGSICRGELKDSSDLDISIVRKPGFINAIYGLWFITKEKKRSDIYKIPLELYLNDVPKTSVNRFKREDNPLVLYDQNNVINNYYDSKISLDKAKTINGI